MFTATSAKKDMVDDWIPWMLHLKMAHWSLQRVINHLVMKDYKKPL